MDRRFCSRSDWRPGRSDPDHAPRRRGRVGRIGYSARARRRLAHASARSLSAGRPSRPALARDAWSDRIRSLRLVPKALGRLFAAFGELGPSMAQRAQPSSLNRPTGPHRSLSTVVVDMSRVHELAHNHGATVNDLVLTAVTGALHELLTERGEHLDSLVVSVPFASRTRTEPDQLGNRSGVIPVKLPTRGGFSDRLSAVSAIMRAAKQQERGASTAVLGPLFRLLARLAATSSSSITNHSCTPSSATSAAQTHRSASWAAEFSTWCR